MIGKILKSAKALYKLTTSLVTVKPVSADPVTASLALAMGGGTMATIAATAIVQIGMAIAVTGLGMLLTDKPQQPDGGISSKQTLTGDTIPQKIIFGTYATAGQAICPPMYRDKKNRRLQHVIALADSPITGFRHLIASGRDMEFKWKEDRPEQWGTINIEGTFYDGTQTAVCDRLLALYGNYRERPWTEDHILKGVAYVAPEAFFDDRFWSGFPEYKFVVDGSPLYNPLKDSTVGGVGNHRFDDPSTWEFTTNPIIMVYNLLRGFTMPDGKVYGVGATVDQIPLEYVFAAANLCDEEGSDPNSEDYFGDKKRYQAGIEISLDTSPLDIIDQLLTTCGGKIADVGGQYILTAGAGSAPIASISDDIVIVSSERKEVQFQGLKNIHNSATASYPDHKNQWMETTAEPYYNDAFIAEDGGLQLVADIKLSACPYPAQVRRLMRENVDDARKRRMHTITLPPSYVGIRPLDTITWTSEAKGYSAKQFEVQTVQIEPANLNVTIEVRERDASDFDFDFEFDNVKPNYPNRTVVMPVVEGVEDAKFEAITIKDNDGNSRRPAIQISWEVETNESDSVLYEVGLTDGTIIASGSSPYSAGKIIIAEGILAGQSYRVRTKINAQSVVTLWSEWVTVTTSEETKLDMSDFKDEVAIDFENVKKAAAQANSIIGQAENLIGQAQSSANSAYDFSLAANTAKTEAVAASIIAMQGANSVSNTLSTIVTSLDKFRKDQLDSIPSHFDGTGTYWTYQRDGQPHSVPNVYDNGLYSWNEVRRDCVISGSGTDDVYLLGKGVLHVKDGDTYRISTTSTTNANTSKGKTQHVYVLLDQNYQVVGEERFNSLKYSTGYQYGEHQSEYTISEGSGAVFLRVGIVVRNSLANSTMYINRIKVDDLSQAVAAANSATDSAAWANTSSQYAAFSSAYMQGANTAYQGALISEKNSLASSQDAAGSASLASREASIAVTAANTANVSAQASLASKQAAEAYANAAGQFVLVANGYLASAQTSASQANIARNDALLAANTATGAMVAANTNAALSINAASAAGKSASAAANSATLASGSANSSAQSANTSRVHMLSANTYRGQAQTYSIQSAASADAANASASLASAQAGLATSAKNDALGYANASLASSQKAAGHADTASTSAAASEQSRIAAEAGASATLPSTMEDDGKWWTQSISGTPKFKGGLGDYTLTKVGDFGAEVYVRSPLAGNQHVAPRSYIPNIKGRRWRVTVSANHLNAFSGGSENAVRIRFRKLAADYSPVTSGDLPAASGTHNPTFPRYSSYVDMVAEFVCDGESPWIVPFAYFDQAHLNNSGPSIFIRSIKIEDVSESTAASDAASAAATSERNAAASKAGAEQSASASQTSASQANTAKGHAEAAQRAAATSESNAKGSENAAQLYQDAAARMTSGGVSPNPTFNQWVSAYPTGYRGYAEEGSITKIAGTRYVNAVEIETRNPPTRDRPIFRLSSRDVGGANNPDAVVVRLEIERRAGNYNGTHIWAVWSGDVNKAVVVSVKDEIPWDAELGKIYTVEAIVERPVGFQAGSDPDFRVDIRGAGSSSDPFVRFRLHRFDYEVINKNAVASIAQQAKTTIDGIASSTIGLRTKAGGSSAELELVALSTPNGSASQARIAADNIILDGSVKAPHIGADAVEAKHIKARNIDSTHLRTDTAIISNSKQLALKVVGGAQIDDLSVDTLQIAGQAVTQTVVNYATGTTRDKGNVISLNINRQGYGTRILFNSDVTVPAGVIVSLVTCELWRGDTRLAISYQATSSFGCTIMFYDSDQGKGNTTYTIKYTMANNNDSMNFMNRYIEAQQIKR